MGNVKRALVRRYDGTMLFENRPVADGAVADAGHAFGIELGGRQRARLVTHHREDLSTARIDHRQRARCARGKCIESGDSSDVHATRKRKATREREA
jgi:hypothetical protein